MKEWGWAIREVGPQGSTRRRRAGSAARSDGVSRECNPRGRTGAVCHRAGVSERKNRRRLPQSWGETGELKLKDKKESGRISAYLILSGQHVPRDSVSLGIGG